MCYKDPSSRAKDIRLGLALLLGPSQTSGPALEEPQCPKGEAALALVHLEHRVAFQWNKVRAMLTFLPQHRKHETAAAHLSFSLLSWENGGSEMGKDLLESHKSLEAELGLEPSRRHPGIFCSGRPPFPTPVSQSREEETRNHLSP